MRILAILMMLTLSSCFVSQKTFDEKLNELKNDITIQQRAFDHKEQLLRQAIYDLQTKSDTIIVPHDPAND